MWVLVPSKQGKEIFGKISCFVDGDRLCKAVSEPGNSRTQYNGIASYTDKRRNRKKYLRASQVKLTSIYHSQNT
jgi:hypothetical protein